MQTKKGRCRNRGSRHNAELPKGLFYHWGPNHPLANSDFAIGLLGLHFFFFFFLQNTSNFTHGTKAFNKCYVGIEKHTAVAHPLKPEQPSEKLVEILSFTQKIKTNKKLRYILGTEQLQVFFLEM